MSESIVKNMSKDAVFTRVDDGIESKVNCKVNMYTRKVFGFDAEFENDIDGEYHEYVTIDGSDYNVIYIETYGTSGSDEIYDELLDDNEFWYDRDEDEITDSQLVSSWDFGWDIKVDCVINTCTHEILSIDLSSVDEDDIDALEDDLKWIQSEHVEYFEEEFKTIPKSHFKYYSDDELKDLYWYEDDIHYFDSYKNKRNDVLDRYDDHMPINKCVLVYHNGKNEDIYHKKHFDNYADAYNQMSEEFEKTVENAKIQNAFDPLHPGGVRKNYAVYIDRNNDHFNWWRIVGA